MTNRPAAARIELRRAAQQGSAYIVALLVLVVLTLLGLSLAMVTETEMQIGTNERVTTRTFYSADSGIGIAAVRVLVNNDHTATTVVLRDNPTGGALNAAQQVELSPFHPILDAPCNLCAINQGQDFLEVNHAVTVTSSRVLWSGSDDPGEDAPRQARKTIGVMIEIQPWQMTTESVESLNLPAEELAQIKY
jgi:Tfp pilus assembly protein PilX